MPHLGGAEPVEQLDAEGGSSSARRAPREAPRRRMSASRSELRSLLARPSGCATICCTIVGTLISTVGPVPSDLREDGVRACCARGNSTHDAPTENGKSTFEPMRVAEEQLRHRHRDVVRRQPEHALAVALGGVHERAIGLHDRLRPAGRAAAEQPDRRRHRDASRNGADSRADVSARLR